jgi:serine/threonine-protein phosphatase CPPED1
VDEPTAYSNIDQEFRRKYLDFFKDNKVNALFTGHYHNNKLLEYGPMQLVTTSALGKPLGDAPSGVRVVKIYREKIDHQYYGLEELPDAVTY